MLSSLHIENIAVVKCADWSPGEGFNALTGETGAGKSIVIDSVDLLLGGRVSKDIIRRGEETASVSALFTDIGGKIANRLTELGFEPEGGEIFLDRRISADGRSQARINARAVPVSVLREVGHMLINIHGQHANQQLLDPEKHIIFLDSFAGLGETAEDYSAEYSKYCTLKKEISSISRDESEKERMADMLRFQIEDIDAAKLSSHDEEDKLEAKKNLIKNAAKLEKHARVVYASLYGGERGASAIELIERAASALSEISDFVPKAAEYIEKLRDYKYEIEDIAESVSDAVSYEEEDSDAVLDKIETRLDAIHRLKRKYGADISEILAFRAEAEKKLQSIEGAEEELERLGKELKKSEKMLSELAKRLTAARKNAAAELEKRIMNELSFLDMSKVKFSVEITNRNDGKGNTVFGADGADNVEFFAETNTGGGMKPLSKIASGGELSRMMLAMKCVLAEKDEVGVLIFDEVDTGISGKTSRKIGVKLKQASKGCQVICVTHSAQIASLADRHFLISKAERSGAVETGISELCGDARIGEIARIMGGIELTETVMAAARELLESE